ncbi:hypothetical protein JAAARDRAFT_40697 [Jaapia argillacea MUCL 33604]|uniref:Peptidase A1 domain-containing protein n=1 Tax=Jaapia argillacea MUCL 33604 TaxID=933084 RepID=A0A067PLG8_9AGAM|nr:hypothetical protein JAAARDRAFT_40697 [Jaapia argillacea MUCL 33604]
MKILSLPLSLVVFIIPLILASAPPRAERLTREKRTENGIHLPIYRSEGSRRRANKRDGAVGLGDYIDVTYNVLIQIGTTTTPLILDTGSSDLWVISTPCPTNCSTSSIPLYPVPFPSSSQCTPNPCTASPPSPSTWPANASFSPSGLSASLLYGDSQTTTHAFGPIGSDEVGLAGMFMPGQYFAAINDTNTSVLEVGSAGIFGLGFPVNSVLWSTLFTAQFSSRTTKRSISHATRRSVPFSAVFRLLGRNFGVGFPDLEVWGEGEGEGWIDEDEGSGINLASASFPSFSNDVSQTQNRLFRPTFPDLSQLLTPKALPGQYQNWDPQQPPPTSSSSIPSSSNQNTNTQNASQPTIKDVLNSWQPLGPLVTRLLGEGKLGRPLVCVWLQRDTVDLGPGVGNSTSVGTGTLTDSTAAPTSTSSSPSASPSASNSSIASPIPILVNASIGVLSIGELPEGVEESEMIWADVRGYTTQQGGLPAPVDSPKEVYPIAWEVPLDDVYLDGHKLPRSNLSAPNITLSALIDTGNSLIRGPTDVISHIYTLLNLSSSPTKTIPCAQAHNLSFIISGKQFQVDPRDFASQVDSGNGTRGAGGCVPNLVGTDVPGTGFLYSWSLGDPFLKGVVAAFYYGNLTYPSRDPPKIGFLSTVPANAVQRLEDAVSGANSTASGTLPATSNLPPTGTLPVLPATVTSPILTTSTTSDSSINMVIPTSTGGPLQDLRGGDNVRTSSSSLAHSLGGSCWLLIIGFLMSVVLVEL